MVERREGGESGVKWLQAYRGEAFWEAHHAKLWSRELFETALCRSHTLTPSRPGFNNPFPTLDELKEIVKDPIAYQYEHNDGLKSTMILMNGLVQGFQLCRLHRFRRRDSFNTDVSPDATRSDDVGELLLTIGQQYRANVFNRRGDLSG